MIPNSSKVESAFGMLMDFIDARAQEVAERVALAALKEHQVIINKEVSQRANGKETAKHFGMSYPTFLKQRNKHKFPYIRLGNKTLYDLAELELFLKNLKRV